VRGDTLKTDVSTTRRTAGVHSRERPLGPNGEKICYNCGGPLPKGRRFNCSSECSEEWQCRTSPSYLRRVIHRRDKGVCAMCGIDTDELRREYHGLPHERYDPNRQTRTQREAFIDAHGIPWGRVSTDWWDADHIVPVIEGGGECKLSNFRTLCLPCHKKVTAELRQRMANKNRRARIEKKDQARPLFEELGHPPH
jgi:5-methylcytosine-specific restriction enzyme A